MLLWSFVCLHRHPPGELVRKREWGPIQQGLCSWMAPGTFGSWHPCPQLGRALGLCCPHTHTRPEVCFNNSGAGEKLPVMETNISQLWECALELGLLLFLHLGRSGAPGRRQSLAQRDANSRERLRSTSSHQSWVSLFSQQPPGATICNFCGVI